MRPIEEIAREAAGGWDIVAYTRRTGPSTLNGCHVENTVDDALAMLTRFAAIVRAEALEEAAVIAENTWEAEVGGSEDSSGFAQYGEHSAEAIRRAIALKDAPHA